MPPLRTRKLQVHTLSPDFRAATRIVEVDLPEPGPGQVRVRNEWVGINASDINYTAGKYTPGVKPPFDAGFESVGVIEALGSDVKGLRVGQAVASTGYGAFAEHQLVRARSLIPLPSSAAMYLPLLVSALTASIALEQVGEMRAVNSPGADGKPVKQRVVLVTAAAGGTGLFAVQLAKAAGHHVIGTCSSPDKVAVLKGMGVDRVVNYKEEDLGTVLKREYKRGVDIVYESVGGEMFYQCAANLAVKGRLIIIGFISGYSDGSAWKGSAKGSSSSGSASSAAAPAAAPRARPPLPALLLGKSASVRGFFLNDYTSEFARHMSLLTSLVASGKLDSVVDQDRTVGSGEAPPKKFAGLEQVADAIDHMYSGKNVGKVVVDMRHASWTADASTQASTQGQQLQRASKL